MRRMLNVIAGVFVIVSAAAAQVAAQPPTAPPTVDFTCHGYVEADRGTRAYNCVPKPSQQHLMRTFVPAPGSWCSEGIIDEFPPGRIVFQIRCFETGATPPPPPPQSPVWVREGSGPVILNLPARISRIRIEGTYTGDFQWFEVWCGTALNLGGVIVDEALGTDWDTIGTRYSGVHSTLRLYNGRGEPCREITIPRSLAIDWKISEVPASMLLPPMGNLEDDLAAVEEKGRR